MTEPVLPVLQVCLNDSKSHCKWLTLTEYFSWHSYRGFSFGIDSSRDAVDFVDGRSDGTFEHGTIATPATRLDWNCWSAAVAVGSAQLFASACGFFSARNLHSSAPSDHVRPARCYQFPGKVHGADSLRVHDERRTASESTARPGSAADRAHIASQGCHFFGWRDASSSAGNPGLAGL